jgi:hypothetical protein
VNLNPDARVGVVFANLAFQLATNPPPFWVEVGKLVAHGNPRDQGKGDMGLSQFGVRAIACLPPDRTRVLCCVPYRCELVIANLTGNKGLSVLSNLSLAEPAPQKATHTLSFITNWANQLVDEYIRLALPAGEQDAANAWRFYLNQYHQQLQLCHDWAREQAVASGYSVDPEDWYAGAFPQGTQEQFLYPVAPNLTHALVFSLTLALPPDQAIPLMRSAEWLDRGFILYQNPKAPNDPRPAQAGHSYESARRLLREACFDWAQSQQYTPWRALRARGVHPASVLEALQAADQSRALAASKKYNGGPAESYLLKAGPPALYGEAPKGAGLVDLRGELPVVDPTQGGTF